MKKILLASTALVAFAGAAAANDNIALSGSAELGVVGGGGDIDREPQFMQSIDVRFSLSAETDGGLVFGGTIDLDDVSDSSTQGLGDVTGYADFTVFVSGEFGTVTMGDTDGALDWAMQDPAAVGSPGSIADDETAHFGREDTYLDGDYDGQVLRYDYTYGDFGFAVSLEMDDANDAELDAADRDRYDPAWAVGAKWSPELGAGVLKLGIGYQESDNGSVTFGSDDTNIQVGFGEDASVWGLSAAYEMDNGFSIGAVYSDWDSDALKSGSHWAIGGGFSWDAFSIAANYGERDFDVRGSGDVETSGWGLAMGYDLGGGLSVLAGYGNSEASARGFADDDATSNGDIDWDSYSLGLSMSF
ncbi:porin [Tropicimonas sediminicola]|uniref:Outer membrane protein OmpU n=1 Tax=Tropicimonas sediminicola TaxID=1031541 RepID=A0A239JJD0_9RHOB|nr:porin [Tropicimonas sediminicola]SNT05692.1 outer membrane protein OmpU [Tropicimonas sediminicola]